MAMEELMQWLQVLPTSLVTMVIDSNDVFRDNQVCVDAFVCVCMCMCVCVCVCVCVCLSVCVSKGLVTAVVHCLGGLVCVVYYLSGYNVEFSRKL